MAELDLRQAMDEYAALTQRQMEIKNRLETLKAAFERQAVAALTWPPKLSAGNGSARC